VTRLFSARGQTNAAANETEAAAKKTG